MLVSALLLALMGCASRASVTVTTDSSDEGWHRYTSAGWLGCQPERVDISEVKLLRHRGAHAWTWLAECEGTTMVCSGWTDVRCAALRPSSDQPTASAAERPLVTHRLPPEIIECTERPVAVEGLFDDDGRLQDLRPWPGETPEQRACVANALGDMDVPEWRGALIRFVPRDPWNETAEP